MSHAIKPPLRGRRSQRPVRSPLPQADEAPAGEAALPFAPAEKADPPRIDIERVDEHRIGGVESVPHPEPEDAITGFVEPADGDERPLPEA
jgi:hypothetical protein